MRFTDYSARQPAGLRETIIGANALQIQPTVQTQGPKIPKSGREFAQTNLWRASVPMQIPQRLNMA